MDQSKLLARLFEAISTNDLPKIKLLINAGVDVNWHDDQDLTALHVSMWHGRTPIIQYLIEKGANVNAIDKKGTTPLHIAVYTSSASKEILKLLIDHGADINASDEDGNTPFNCICGRQDIKEDILEMFLNKFHKNKSEPEVESNIPESDNTRRPFTIFLVGEVSSGKSSTLNALAGGMISSTSLQRETFSPEIYHFSNSGSEDTVRKLADQIEASYKDNEHKRGRIADIQLEDIINPLDKSYGTIIPTRLDIQAYDIIDFPGINDIEDRDNKFLKAIEHNIGNCDLMIYISDATRSFQTSSEVQLFKKLQKIVYRENCKGHFVDLSIIVNKFDNLSDPDLGAIYARIGENINIDPSKVFRCCSHKMLVARILNNKLNIYIPRFVIREFQKVLQTANVNVSQKLKTRLVETSYISHLDIEYLLDLESEWQKEKEPIEDFFDHEAKHEISHKGNLDGDWDNLICWLTDFGKNLDSYRVKAFSEYVDFIFDNLLRKLLKNKKGIKKMKPYSTIPFEWERRDEIIALPPEDISEYFDDIRLVYKLFESNPQIMDEINFERKLIKLMIILSRFESLDIETLIYSFLDYFSEIVPNLVSNFVEYVFNKEQISWYSRQLVLYSFEPNIFKSTGSSNKYYECLGDERIWMNKPIEHYDIREDLKFIGFDKKPGKYEHNSWFINNLMNETEDKNLEMLLVLATTKIKTLRAWHYNKILPYKEIEKCLSLDHVRQLQYYLANLKADSEKLEHRLFKLDGVKNFLEETENFMKRFLE